ncbi:MAG: exodeoxyribonuclease V subunit alpha [Desulfobacteraceae bacterium]|nr:MAG: exodeoxyribonuclease V subunit alpha [Desulfobacteraceae bacterium]
MLEDLIKQLNEQGLLRPIDLHFARLMQRLSGQADPRISVAAALVSKERREGHICLDLSKWDGRTFSAEKDQDVSITLPGLVEWTSVLRASSVVGEPGQYKPLILDRENRLYLYRYWEYQARLSESIHKRLLETEPTMDPEFLKSALSRYFTEDDKKEINRQKIAAFTCLRKRFSIISGGPGTGKTFTVAKILALLIEQSAERVLRIALAAPTGKGAARLQETIKKIKTDLPCPESVKQLVPDEAKTIHRLLKTIPGSPYFRFNRENPLPLDILVLDEASMVDLALMSKLVQALPPTARLIVLGDKDQLASVEAGAVFGDMCDTGASHNYSKAHCLDLEAVTGYKLQEGQESAALPGLQDCLTQLRRSYRFSQESKIAALSRAVNEGNADLVMTILKNSKKEDEVCWRPLPRPEDLAHTLKTHILDRFQECFQATEPREFFKRFEKFRILCGLRQGPYGVTAMNQTIETLLNRSGPARPGEKWYQGRPVLVTRNDYHLNLFNGDSGVVWPDPKAGQELRVYFPGAEGELQRFHPLRIPEHETLYAMTVHKSQGSEFDELLLILPDRDAPVLTRELIYTAITRARHKVTIWGPEEVLRLAISRRTERTSGLRDELWK